MTIRNFHLRDTPTHYVSSLEDKGIRVYPFLVTSNEIKRWDLWGSLVRSKVIRNYEGIIPKRLIPIPKGYKVTAKEDTDEMNTVAYTLIKITP